MNRLQFYASRLMRNEAVLQRLSAPPDRLLAELEGRSVALVGNARSLSQTCQGAAIDAADMVIRINRAPMPAPVSHGRRTDWLALATSLPSADRHRLAPSRILWMSPKRKRLAWNTAADPGFYLHPTRDYRALKDRLAAPPTTGAMMIDFLLRSRLDRLTLHGFDFFASQSLSGRRTADQVPHDFKAEAAWVADLMGRDARLTVQPTAGAAPLPSTPCLR